VKRLTAVAALLVLLLAGCSEIPSSGTVQNGSTEGPNDTTIVYFPNPPAPGANPQNIVSGFLAAASAGGDFRVARQYLASSFVKSWKPGARVLVQEAQPTITATSNVAVTAQVSVSGEVDAAGVYTPRSHSLPLSFHLKQQSGQWRIDDAPDGIVLGQTAFGKLYVPQPLEYFDPTYSRLVPDLRWLPLSATSTSKSGSSALTVVRKLIAGPAGPLAGDVAVNALRGATVESVDSGVSDITTVALTTSGPAPNAEATGRMQQQLIQSLLLPTSSALRLFVNGRVAPQAKALPTQPRSALPYVVSKGRFGTVATNGTFTEEPTLGKRIAALRPDAVTVAVRRGLAVARTAGGEVVAVTTSGQKLLDSRPDLVPPTLDQRGWMYSVPRDDPRGLVAVDAKGQHIDLAGNLGGATVTSIEASPDGTRMLVLVQSATGPKAFVAGIERNSEGTPTGLTRAQYPVALGGNGGTGLDATWADDGNVAVLVSSTDNTTVRVRLQQLGGFGSSAGELANATSIVGGTSKDDLRIRLQTGDVWLRKANLWQSASASPADVSVLAVQR
jgi:hypothetical protein